jgi:glycerophosphoryl diester phosphodiesterase
MDTSDAFLDRVAEAGFDLDVYLSNITEDFVKRCHERGIKVNTWTADFLEDAEKFVEWGVDYITSHILE